MLLVRALAVVIVGALGAAATYFQVSLINPRHNSDQNGRILAAWSFSPTSTGSGLEPEPTTSTSDVAPPPSSPSSIPSVVVPSATPTSTSTTSSSPAATSSASISNPTASATSTSSGSAGGTGTGDSGSSTAETSSGTASGSSSGTTSGTTTTGTRTNSTSGTTSTSTSGTGSTTNNTTTSTSSGSNTSTTPVTATTVNPDGTVTSVTTVGGEVTTTTTDTDGTVTTSTTTAKSSAHKQATMIGNVPVELTGMSISSPLIQAAAATVVPAVIAVAGPAAGIIILNTFQAFSNLPGLFSNLWTHFMFFFGIKRRREPWGKVLNSATTEPIANAIVTLYLLEADGRSKMVEKVTTDQEGRYGFLVAPGNYFITVQRANFTFPTQVLRGVYAGHAFRLDNQKTLTLDLFCDPAEATISFMGQMRRLTAFFDKFRLAFLVVGTGLVIYGYTLQIDLFNILLGALYVFLWINEIMQSKQGRHTLQLLDTTGKPLPFTILRLFAENSQTALLTKVTDALGETYILVPAGHYQLQIPSPRNPAGTVQTIDLPHGIVPKHTIVRVNY